MTRPDQSPAHPAPEADVPSGRYVRVGGLVGGVVLALLICLFGDLGSPAATRMGAVAVLMAVWWITEALPLGATALVPLVAFPFLGIMSGAAVSREYGHWVIALFVGGFLIALAMERWNLHRRIALNVLALVGGRPGAVLLGFMAATALLSMGISNTATTMMMVPIALAILLKWEELSGAGGGGGGSRFASSLMLGIPYAASIGGIATLVGTPPNAALVGIYSRTFPKAAPLEFGRWFLFGLPLSLVLLGITWGVLSWRLRGSRAAGSATIEQGIVHRELEALGPMSREEACVLGVFVSAGLAWVFRKPLEIGGFTVPGWSSAFEHAGMLNDGTVAIACALVLFLIPARTEKLGGRLLDVSVFPKLPWGIVLLFGGGFALAAGFEESGLSQWVGERLAGLAGLPLPLLIAIVCLVITLLTEVTSNTASAQILLPILASLAVELELDPLVLMVPGAISCSCAFMLPVATPPNAIAFATGHLRMADMVRVGLLLNLIAVGVTTAAVLIWL